MELGRSAPLTLAASLVALRPATTHAAPCSHLSCVTWSRSQSMPASPGASARAAPAQQFATKHELAALMRVRALGRAISNVRQAIQEVETDGCAAVVVSRLCGVWGHQRVERLVMLGLGSVSSSTPARYQLALGLVLARELLDNGMNRMCAASMRRT